MNDPPETAPIVTPVLRGGRFTASPLVPLELLSDFRAYESMVVEVAKAIFLAENPGERQVPHGFAGSFELALTEIEGGSTRAVLKRVLVTSVLSAALATTAAAPSSMPDLFDAARDKVSACIEAVEKDGHIPADFPRAALAYFKKFGASLREGESLELVSPGQVAGPTLTPEVRSRLTRAPEAQAERVVLTGTIVAVDAKKRTFDLEDAKKHRAIPYHPEMHVALAACLSKYLTAPEDAQARVTVTACRDSSGKISTMEALQVFPVSGAVTPLEVQLQELRDLKDGWLDGDGQAINTTLLEKVRSILSRLPADLKRPNPYLYPMQEGGVRCEWDIGSWKVAAVMEPEEPDVLALTALNLETNSYHSHDTNVEHWADLAGCGNGL